MNERQDARSLGIAIAMVVAATAGTFAVYDWIEPSISLLFFPAVVISAIYGGYGSALVATVLSTASLAFFFVPPRGSFNIGIDDAFRLAAFAAVSFATAWLGSARRRAERSQQRSLEELEAAIETLKKVGDWPILVGPDADASVGRILQHAADVLNAQAALVIWETDDEPWRYLATSAGSATRLDRQSPVRAYPLMSPALEHATFVTPNGHADANVSLVVNGVPSAWHGRALQRTSETEALVRTVASAPFRSIHVNGRLFLGGMPEATATVIPAVELVAREVGNSLDQLHVARQTRDLAVREDRLRLSRDLHDGVLQALTGIRLELKSIAEDDDDRHRLHERLQAIERALAVEQRDLRRFIDELRPAAESRLEADSIAGHLDETCSRLSAEWRTPVAVRVQPPTLSLQKTDAQALRLMIHEAVANALKHAHPSRVTVDVDSRVDQLSVVVADDGRGFPFRGTLEGSALATQNVGPVSLRERVTALNGRLRVESTSSGSRVEFSIPIRPVRTD